MFLLLLKIVSSMLGSVLYRALSKVHEKRSFQLRGGSFLADSYRLSTPVPRTFKRTKTPLIDKIGGHQSTGS
jgi:hypothetical protein